MPPKLIASVKLNSTRCTGKDRHER
jgi:hypothetical protein